MDNNGYNPDDTIIEGEEDEGSMHYRAEKTVSVHEVRTGRSIADFAREAEGGNKHAVSEQHNNDIESEFDDYIDMLSDIDTGESFERRRPAQVLTEYDMPQEPVTRRARVSDMFDKYAINGDNGSVSHKAAEKMLEGGGKDSTLKYNENAAAKQTNEVYHSLADEQETNKMQKGFIMLFMLIILGLAVSAITFLKLNWELNDIYIYLTAATAFFSIILLIKVKLFKYLSCVYFALNAVMLAGPGLIKYLIDPAPKPADGTQITIYYIAAIAISAIICIALATNMDIDDYYSTSLNRKKRRKNR